VPGPASGHDARHGPARKRLGPTRARAGPGTDGPFGIYTITVG
jgi:hypothetical protein